jgi:hypothetical protein
MFTVFADSSVALFNLLYSLKNCSIPYIFLAKGRRQKAPELIREGTGQKVYYWYVVARAVRAVLTFMATAISSD